MCALAILGYAGRYVMRHGAGWLLTTGLILNSPLTRCAVCVCVLRAVPCVHQVFYLLSNDRINALITHRFDFGDEELMAYYVCCLCVCICMPVSARAVIFCARVSSTLENTVCLINATCSRAGLAHGHIHEHAIAR